MPELRTSRARREWFAALLVICFVLISHGASAQDDQPNAQPVQSPEKPQRSPQQQTQNPQDSTPVQQPTTPEKKDDSPTHQVAETTKKLEEETLDKVRDWEVGWITGPYISRNHKRVALTAKQRRDIYLEETFTTSSAYFKRAFTAAIDQARDSPSQWPEGWGGYGERFASREGQFFAADSLAALGDAKLKYEPRYDQCRCSGFWPRARHAILRNFLTYDESEQHLHPQWALYGGAFGGGVIAASWKPHLHSVFTEGGIAAVEEAGYGSAINLLIEFSGEINRKLWRRK
jgi:hypothetical protein